MEKDNLMKSIEESDEFFCQMVDLIPPEHFGFDEEIKSKLKTEKHETTDRKLKNAERKRLKEHGKQLLSRLDTDNCRTVTQIWAWLANQKPSVAQRNNKSNFENNSSDLVPKVSNGSGSLLNKNTQLLTKLQTKLAEMRQNRKADTTKDKKKRLSNSKKRKNEGKSNKDHKKAKIENDSNAVSSSNEEEKPLPTDSSKQLIKNSSGEIVYSKFDFSVFGVKSNERKGIKNKNLTGKDYKKLLKTVEKRDQNLANLKEENPEKGFEVEKKQHWDAAMDRVRGVKVKDDKNLLKQNIKRKEHRKKQSEKQWHKREEFVEKKIQKRQDDRKRNIQQKKQKNKLKKLEKAKKKGRLVPGSF